jgi:hypothetical protein
MDEPAMKPLPDALSRAWKKHAMRDMGGWIELMGGDPYKVFDTSKPITDHPWLNLTIHFPMLAESGWPSEAVITKCIIHPQGELMFDFQFPEPVPSHLYCGGEWILHDSQFGNTSLQRLRYSALKELALLTD